MDNEAEVKIKKKFFTKKRVIWTVIILVIVVPIVLKISKGKNPADGIQTDTVKKQDLKATVLATGQVVSQTDLDLSFKSSGIVSKVYVKEGDKVKTGQVLASLSQNDQAAALTSAKGALASAKANYQKVLAGSSSEDVAVSQAALDSAKSALKTATDQQKVLVDNAYQALVNSGLSAAPDNNNTGSVTVTITGAYTGKDQGIYKIAVYTTGAGSHFQVSGLETSDGLVSSSPQPLGTKGLYIQFSSSSVPAGNAWSVAIPNTQSSTYVTYYNAYQAALSTQATAIAAAQNTVASAQAALDLKKAQARPADVAAAEAQILSAQGQVQAAESNLENTEIRAPADGTVTSVDIKVGEQATASKPVVSVQDVSNLHVEAFVSEANIDMVKPGLPVDYTFDTLGSDRHFAGKVEFVNPSSVVQQGVVNFKVTASVDDLKDLLPGITANMTVLTLEKTGVLAIPQRAVLSNGSKKVRVIDDSKKKTYHEVEVTLGMDADGGLVEVTSGLSEGQEIITFIKQ